MEENLYQAPKAELVTESNTEAEFYVVSSKKFLVLFITTMGIYCVYWFYKHWRQQKITQELKIWPVMRAIFSVFFTHSLFAYIDGRVRDARSDFAWSPGVMATIYVVFSIIASISDNLAANAIGFPYTDFLGTGCLLFIGSSMHRAQMAANIACGDSEGSENANFTGLNFLWIVLGSLFWVAVLLGYYAILTGYGI